MTPSKRKRRQTRRLRKHLKKYSDIARRIMESLGWKCGKGLGKHEQGITTPINITNTRTSKDKRGLGYINPDVKPSADTTEKN